MTTDRVCRVLLAVALAAGLMAACGGGDGGSLPGAASGGAPGGGGVAPSVSIGGNALGRCDVRVTGDLSLTLGSVGDGMVFSRHWQTESERKLLNIDRALQVACSVETSGGSFNAIFQSANAAQDKDVPYGPKEYALTGQNPAVDQFQAIVLINDVPYLLSEPGRLRVSRFDSRAIAGSFQMRLQEMPGASTQRRSVTVEGTFDYPCDGSAACKR